jgi:hypothetical protein
MAAHPYPKANRGLARKEFMYWSKDFYPVIPPDQRELLSMPKRHAASQNPMSLEKQCIPKSPETIALISKS